jgi:nucleoside-diphosphate kinase
MEGKITFTIIKPKALSRHLLGSILKIIYANGFHVVALKMIQMTMKQAEQFYGIHKGKPFYNYLINHITSGPIVVAILQKDNAVKDFRKLIGATDPKEAEEGTIRKLYALSVQENAIHGSDSDENAVIESNFFFSKSERYYYRE